MQVLNSVNSTAKQTVDSKQFEDNVLGVAYKHKQVNPKQLYLKDHGPAKSPSSPESSKFGVVLSSVIEQQPKKILQKEKSPKSKTVTKTELGSSFHLKQEIS